MVFDRPGRENTDETLRIARERARERSIDEIVVASTNGDTAFKAAGVFDGCRITVVTYHCGFREPFQSVMGDDVRKELEAKGMRVVSATHALSGVERSVAGKYGGVYPSLLIADTLRLFGHGTKVAVEIAVMAADAGCLTGADIVSIGGTSRGADAALVLKPAGQSHLFDMRIREVICKPRDF